MPVYYDEDSGALAIGSNFCECGQPFYDTGCDAPGCNGYCCMECGTGCDIEFDPEDGRCAAASAAESDDDYEARVNTERAAFGLSPIQPEAAPGAAGQEE